MRLANKAHRFGREIPFKTTFAFFRPTLALSCHTKGEYLNPTVRRITLFQNFSYGYEPIDRLLTLPRTPASSKASFAAVSYGGIPRLGHPFGIIQRRVPRDVTSIISKLDLPFARKGRAAY